MRGMDILLLLVLGFAVVLGLVVLTVGPMASHAVGQLAPWEDCSDWPQADQCQ